MVVQVKKHFLIFYLSWFVISWNKVKLATLKINYFSRSENFDEHLTVYAVYYPNCDRFKCCRPLLQQFDDFWNSAMKRY